MWSLVWIGLRGERYKAHLECLCDRVWFETDKEKHEFLKIKPNKNSREIL